MYLDINIHLSEVQCRNIYLLLLNNISLLNANSSIYKTPLVNNFIYNNLDLINENIHITDTLFSFYYLIHNNKSQLILHTNYCLNYIERDIIKIIDHEINYNSKHSIKFQINDYDYRLKTKLSILSEVKSCIIIFYILLKIIKNMCKSLRENDKSKLIQNNQIHYSFTNEEINKIRSFLHNKNLSYEEDFKLLIIISIFNILKNNYMVLYNTNKNQQFLLHNITTTNVTNFKKQLEIYIKGTHAQKLIKKMVFSDICTVEHNLKILDINCIYYDYDNIILDKINTKNKSNLIPCQINCYLSNTKLNIDISLNLIDANEIDLFKLIIPEMFMVINNDI